MTITSKDIKNVLSIGTFCGLFGLLIYGSIELEKQAKIDAEKRAAEKKAFEDEKNRTIRDAAATYEVYELTLHNKNLNSEDRAYMYGKFNALHERLLSAPNGDELRIRNLDYIRMGEYLNGDKESIDAYVLYLKQQDEKADKAAQEAAIRRSEREKIEAEQNALKLRLDAESKKTDAIVDSIKAIANAGKTDSSDVNVTINNSKED